MQLPAMFVCLLARLLKNACMDLDDILRGRTDQFLSPIRIIVRMPEPNCFLRYDIVCTATRGISLRRENPTYMYWACLFAARRSNNAWF